MFSQNRAGDQIGPFLIIGGFGTLGKECNVDPSQTTPTGPSPTTAPEPTGALTPPLEQCEICSRDFKNKPLSLLVEYQPDGENSQYQPEDKASCRAGSYPATTTVGVNGQTFGPLGRGDRILLDGQFGANTEFDFDGANSCTIHTSCSVPLV